jgi:putative restriction endonuclease
MKAVFDTKPDSAYDDDVASRYHFPRRYLDVASKSVGDWVVFRRPRAGGGTKAYFAVGRVARIEPDPTSEGYYYATIVKFLPFDLPVPWLLDGRYSEAALRNLQKVSQIGLFLRGRSIRPLEEADFVDIVSQGLSETLDPRNAVKLGLDANSIDSSTAALLDTPPMERERRIVEMLINRKIRDASFRRNVCEAYGDRCTVTGLRIVNGGGRAEVQAAHIWSVGEGGPDTVQNGIALSATAHWLFDRHLISLTDDYGLLVSHNKVPAELRSLFERQTKRIHLPLEQRLWPRLSYVARHRDAFANA